MKTKIVLLVLAVLVALAVAYQIEAADQVAICHVPPGNTANAQSLKVASSAAPAHLAHGDSMGACPVSGSK